MRIEEVVLILNEFRSYVDGQFAEIYARFDGMDARFAQVHETIATNTQILLAAIGGLKRA